MQYIGIDNWAKATVAAEKEYMSHPSGKKNKGRKGFIKTNLIQVVQNKKDMERLYELASEKVNNCSLVHLYHAWQLNQNLINTAKKFFHSHFNDKGDVYDLKEMCNTPGVQYMSLSISEKRQDANGHFIDVVHPIAIVLFWPIPSLDEQSFLGAEIIFIAVENCCVKALANRSHIFRYRGRGIGPLLLKCVQCYLKEKNEHNSIFLFATCSYG